VPVTVLKIIDLFAGLHLPLHLAQRGIQVVGMNEEGVRVGEQLIHGPTQCLREGGVEPLEITVAT